MLHLDLTDGSGQRTFMLSVFGFNATLTLAGGGMAICWNCGCVGTPTHPGGEGTPMVVYPPENHGEKCPTYVKAKEEDARQRTREAMAAQRNEQQARNQRNQPRTKYVNEVIKWAIQQKIDGDTVKLANGRDAQCKPCTDWINGEKGAFEWHRPGCPRMPCAAIHCRAREQNGEDEIMDSEDMPEPFPTLAANSGVAQYSQSEWD